MSFSRTEQRPARSGTAWRAMRSSARPRSAAMLVALFLGASADANASAAAFPRGASQEGRAGDGKRLVVMVEEDFLDSWSVLEDIAREMEREHAGLDVELLPLSGAAGSQDRAKFLIAGGVQLDLMRIDITELAAYAAEGALLDLDPLFDVDPTWDPSAYYPAALDAIRGADGHLYGLPSTFTPYVMYANLDLLRELGVDLAPLRAGEWTWDDFLAIARAATADLDGDGRTDRYGVSLTQWLQAVVPWVWQNGARLIDAGGERARMDEPAFREAMHFLHDLLHVERVASFDASFANQLSQGLFQAGRAALYGPVGYWETYRFRRIEAFEWDVVPLPCGLRSETRPNGPSEEVRTTAVAMTVYVVPRTAREPELAYELLRRLAGERYQRTLAEIGNGVPGLIAAAESESFLKPNVAPASEQVFLDAMATARFLPPLANWRKIEALTNAQLQGILLVEDEDVDAACARMAETTDAYLARERARASREPLPAGTMEGALALSLLAALALFVARRGRRVGVSPRRERQAYALLLPWASGLVLFLAGPAVVSLVLSLTEWSPLRPLDDARWLGGENYARLLTDGTFHTSIGATLLFAALSVPLSLATALALALLLRAEGTLSSIARTICYLPAVIAPVIVGAVWRSILDADEGLLNGLLARVGIDGPAWLRDPDWVVPSFVLMSLWSVGAQMLVFLAALQALDPTLEESARMDGAGRWSRFRHVTLPQLTPVVLFNLVTGLITAVQIFAQPYVMTEGGPGDASRFLVLYLYESGFRHLDMGYASAIAFVLAALLALFSLGLLASSSRWVHYAGRRER